MKKRTLGALLFIYLLSICQISYPQLGKLVSKAKSISTSHADSEPQSNSVTNTETPKATNAVNTPGVIFSSSKFNAGTNTPKNSFQEGDNIFARIELNKPIKSIISKDMDDALYMGLSYKIDDENNDFMVYLEASNFDKNSNILDFDVVAAPDMATTYYRNHTLPSFIKNAMENVPANSKVEFTIELDSYVGTFTLQKKSDASFGKWIDPICQHAQKMMDEKDVQRSEAKMQKEDKLPDAFHKPSEKFDDPELSMVNIRKYLSKEFHVDKIVIGPGADYDVRKDSDGLINSKVTHRYILFSYKDDKTGKCYYNACFFYRDYEGGGKYGSLHYSYDVYPVLLTSCNEVNPK